MKTVDVMGKPCPIPVIEAKKVLALEEEDSVLVKVDNIVSVQNLEKMAKGYGYSFFCAENSNDSFDVTIIKNSKNAAIASESKSKPEPILGNAPLNGLAVVIGKDAMGSGSEELGKILIKGFIYSLTALPTPPKYVMFFNAGAFLTSEDANTIDDLINLEQQGTEILTCGTCVNYYGLKDKLAVGSITDMYGITERMTLADNIINI